MKNSSDNIAKRTRVLPACSAVPQPTAPPRDSNYSLLLENYSKWNDVSVIMCTQKKYYNLSTQLQETKRHLFTALLLFRLARWSIYKFENIGILPVCYNCLGHPVFQDKE